MRSKYGATAYMHADKNKKYTKNEGTDNANNTH